MMPFIDRPCLELDTDTEPPALPSFRRRLSSDDQQMMTTQAQSTLRQILTKQAAQNGTI
jgi:hypothetical protein